MSPNNERLMRPNLLDQGSRFAADKLVNGYFHTERAGSQEGLERAIELNAKGYGIDFNYLHKTKYEGPALGGEILSHPQFRSRPLVVPIALHQYEEHKVLLRVMEMLARGNLVTVVTEDTMNIPEYQQSGIKLNDGMRLFQRLGAAALLAGGTVELAPQVKRDIRLDTGNIPTAVGALLSKAIDMGAYKIALLSVGIDFREITHPVDYNGLRDIKFGNLTPIVQYGRCVTLEELGYTPDMKGTRTGLQKLREINKWAFYELATVTDNDYLPPGFDMSEQPDLLGSV